MKRKTPYSSQISLCCVGSGDDKGEGEGEGEDEDEDEDGSIALEVSQYSEEQSQIRARR